MRTMRAIVLGICVGTVLASVSVAGPELLDLSLEEILNVAVVSVSKTEKPILESPVSAVVVTRDEILSRGYRDLLDVLRDLPGVHVVDLAISEHAASEIVLRGIDANSKMLFLLDGEEMAPATGEPFTFLRNVPLVDVKQIELSYGAAASLYGADAIAGILNVVTLTAEEQADVGSELWMGGGSHQTYEGQVRHQVRFGDETTLSLRGSFFSSSQENLPESYPKLFDGYEVDPLLQSHNLRARLERDGLSLSWMRMEGSRNNGIGFVPSMYDYSGKSVWDTRNDFWRLRWNSGGSGPWSSRSLISYSTNRLDPRSTYSTDFTGNSDYVPHSFYWRGRATRIAQELQWQGESVGWLAGADMQWFRSTPKTDLANPLGSYDVHYRNAGAFVQAEIEASEQLDFTAGARFDKDSRFSGEWNPRLGVLYHPTSSFRAHASWGTAYLAPSPHKVYERWGQIAEGEYVHLPNEELRPEQTSTFDVGTGWFPSHRSYVSVSGFHTQAEDLWRIDFRGPAVIDGYNVVYQTNANVASSTFLGFHVTGEMGLTRHLRLGTHYTYTGGEQDSETGDGVVEISHMPRHLLQLSSTWSGRQGHMRLTGRWYDRIRTSELNPALPSVAVGGAWTLDLFAERRLPLNGPDLRVGLDVRNLLDEAQEKVSRFDYAFFLLPTIPQPRRSVALTARLAF